MSDLMKQLDKLNRMRVVKSAIPDSILGVTLKDSKRGPLVRFEQVKTVIGQWVADNSDLLAAQTEVTRLRGLFEQILAHPDDTAYDARFWRNLAREALKEPS